jgi:ParB/RepB/Spo0J family partition protein
MWRHETKDVPLADLVEPWLVMRPVRRESVDYLELKDAIDREGLLSSISARPSPRLPGKYEIITGLYRFAIAQELGWDTIPCIIKHGITDDDVLALQVQENSLRPKTKPIEFSLQLKRIFDRQRDMSIAELSRKVGKSASWIKNRLNLEKLSSELKLMVDRGEIPIQSAYMLAKIPLVLREDYVQHACTMPPAQFRPMAAGVIKRFAECVHQGKMDERNLPKYEPVAYLRSLAEIKAEIDHPQVRAMLLVTENCKTPLDAWNACLDWVIHMDRQSKEQQTIAANTRHRKQIEREVRNDPID